MFRNTLILSILCSIYSLTRSFVIVYLFCSDAFISYLVMFFFSSLLFVYVFLLMTKGGVIKIVFKGSEPH